MATLKTTEQVKAILSEVKVKGKSKPILFGDEISKLKSGEALLISNDEWQMKTTPAAYYYRAYRLKSDKKTLSVYKVNEGYLITKL